MEWAINQRNQLLAMSSGICIMMTGWWWWCIANCNALMDKVEIEQEKMKKPEGGRFFHLVGTMRPPWRVLATPGRRKGNSVVREPTMLSPALMQPARTTQCCASNSLLASRALLHISQGSQNISMVSSTQIFKGVTWFHWLWRTSMWPG